MPPGRTLAATMLDILTSFPLLLSWRVSPFVGRKTAAMVCLSEKVRPYDVWPREAGAMEQ